MVSQFWAAELLQFKQNLAQTKELERTIAADLQSMDQITIRTRELILDCRRGMRKVDQLLK